MRTAESNSIHVSLSPRRRAVVRNARRALRRKSADLDRLTSLLLEKEAALTAAREAAREADQTRQKFLANMSHELRTPLHSIIGFAAYLLGTDQVDVSPDGRHLVRRIHGNALSLLQLVDMLLDLSKIEAGWVVLETSHVDVLSIAQATAQEMRGQIRGRPLEIVVEGEEGLDTIETDAGKLKLILANLLGNAVKYTPEGRVTVRMERDPASRRPGWINVVDTGPGVAPERRQAIQEVLERGGGVTHRDGRTCLGLGIAAGLARQIGGRIRLLEGVGTGAAFRLDLPQGVPSGARTIPARTLPKPESELRPDVS